MCVNSSLSHTFCCLQIFWDLVSNSTYYQDVDVPLEIHEDKVLGKGGYGFVCEGELKPPVSEPVLSSTCTC